MDDDQRAALIARARAQWVPPEQRAATVPANAAETAPLIRQAWVATAVFALAVLAADGAGVLVRTQEPFEVPEIVDFALLGLAGVVGIVAVALGGRPLKSAGRFSIDFMVSRVYMPGFMGLLPLFAPYVLIEAVIRLVSKSAGGYVTAPTHVGGVDGIGGTPTGGGVRIPRVALTHGEGLPLGVTFLLIGTLWPVACGLALIGT